MRDDSEFLNMDDEPVDLGYDPAEMMELFGNNILEINKEELDNNFPSSAQLDPPSAESTRSSIPAPGPEFEIQPSNDTPQQEAPEESNPYDLSAISGAVAEPTSINGNASETAIPLSPLQENNTAVTETPSPEDENNNETVTNVSTPKTLDLVVIEL